MEKNLHIVDIHEVTERYRTIFDSLDELVVIIDPDLNIVAPNKTALEIFKKEGMDESNILNRPALEVLPIIDKEQVRDELNEILKRGGRFERDAIYEFKSGKIYGKTKGIPIMENDKIGGILILVRDVTKEKIAEELLEKSIERFNHVARIAGEWIWELDANSMYSYSSDASKKIIGYSPEELIGKKHLYDLYPEEDKERLIRINEACIASKEDFHGLVMRVVKKDGSKIYIEESGSVLFNEKGDIVGCRGISTDITDRMEYESNLDKFRLAVEGASDHVVITDEDGIILYANPSVTRTTGYEYKEIIGKTPAIWGKQMPKEFYEYFWYTLKVEKKPFIGEITNKRKDGRIYIAEINVSPIIDNDGKIKFFVGIEHDITKAKEIDRAKTEFVSLASHQLRTPLSIINWYSEMLLGEDKGVISEGQKDYLSEISKANKRMIDLVNALLNVSRIDVGSFAVSPKKINITDISKTVIKEFCQEIDKKSLSVSEKYLPESFEYMGDPDLVRIIFQNLISNSVKYCDLNDSISVSVLLKDDLMISISDTGIGIPEVAKEKIFEKLFRADNARHMDSDGTGLGLYIVKAIVDASSGSISFESEENKGTTFVIRLPKEGMKSREGAKGLK